MLVLANIKEESCFQWESIVDELSIIFHLTEKEKERIYRSPAAKLTAEIAYLSGCNDPERVVLAHVGTIIIASKSFYALHKQGESLYNRIAILDHYPGGNPEIVKGGMLLLELIALIDHQRDKESDMRSGKPNPLLGEINFITERDRLLKEFRALPVNIQELYKMYTEFLPFSWWTY